MQPTLTPAANDAITNQAAAICQGWLGLAPLFLTLSLPASPRRSRRLVPRKWWSSTQRRVRKSAAADRIGRQWACTDSVRRSNGFLLRTMPCGSFLITNFRSGLSPRGKAHPEQRGILRQGEVGCIVTLGIASWSCVANTLTLNSRHRRRAAVAIS